MTPPPLPTPVDATPCRAVRPRNDLGQYDDLAAEWWDADGPFAALHWLAAARGALVPPPAPGAIAVDLAAGGGLMARHLDGYRHVGVDLTASALAVAAGHGVVAVRGDVRRLPVRSATAAVVVAGEIFEHVRPLEPVVAEIARILVPGGVVVFDTINDTRFARLALVRIGERMPGGPPARIHDPALFVAPRELESAFAEHGIDVRMHGLRPEALGYLRFVLRRSGPVRMVRTRSLAGVYGGVGRKRP